MCATTRPYLATARSKASSLIVNLNAPRSNGPLKRVCVAGYGQHVAAPLAHTIFRCVQEALTNAVRHAHAENVYVAVASSEGTVAVTARDDGRGAAELKPGHGLSGLRERIEGMGGTVEIEARAGAGLTLRALLPHREGGAP